jgi:uncharacterized membrane protein YhaH (DUF805 family)
MGLTMIAIRNALRFCLDPRGRADRQDMVIVATAMIAIEIWVAVYPSVNGWWSMQGAIRALATWVAIATTIRRLQDCGKAWWWLPLGFAYQCMWMAVLVIGTLVFGGSTAFAPGSITLLVLMAFVMMPVLGAALWLHLTPGELHTNQFGMPRRSEASVQADSVAQPQV